MTDAWRLVLAAVMLNLSATRENLGFAGAIGYWSLHRVEFLPETGT